MATKNENLREEALRYHSEGRPGKIEVLPTKPYSTQKDLSLAYSPGVAQPCLEIEKDPDNAYKYTDKGNLVAVISNGTAVLGLGNIGAIAGKPVMEGKGLLFKIFAGIDVFDIEVDTTDTEKFIETVKNISPTFGGINLEDIKAPECFEIERRLREELSIPVMHDDQHGTAIISCAALLNWCLLTGKDISTVKVTVNGAGAAAISCASLLVEVGVRRENITMCDSKGVITTSRTDLNEMKKAFATDRDISTLAEAVDGADVFLGLSVAGVLSADMVRTMNPEPLVMALANPEPEITWEEATAARKDLYFATGRSDYPNQVNNVLGFPYIFRGALDVRASKINEQMKIAAAYALAEMAREPVPEQVLTAYNNNNITFGRDYFIPKPFDPRLLVRISSAVAKAAIESGVARDRIEDWDAYAERLDKLMGRDDELIRRIRTKVATAPVKTIALSAGYTENVLRAAADIASDHIARPVLIGDYDAINNIARLSGISLTEVEVIDPVCPYNKQLTDELTDLLYERLKRKGHSLSDCRRLIRDPEWFTAMYKESGKCDAAIITYSRRYTETLQSLREIISGEDELLAAMHIVTTRKGPMFFADTAVNDQPTDRQMADITKMAADTIRCYGVKPVASFLSNSNFGTDSGVESRKVARAVEIVHTEYPNIPADGEMKADIALDRELREKLYPFTTIAGKDPNLFIFPNLASANIAYKIMDKLGSNEVTGPVLLGSGRDIHLISENMKARSIMHLALVAVSGCSCCAI